MANEILTESGTNEFELLSFYIDNAIYGINVSKVREIIKYQKVTPMPQTDDRILGLIMPRDELITCVDLRKCLVNKNSEPSENSLFIVCHFNNKTTAFQVDAVSEIRRLSWDDIVHINDVFSSKDTLLTGVIKTKDGIIGIIDFEKIMVDINPSNGFTELDVENIKSDIINSKRDQDIKVLIAEDSKVLNQLITDTLSKVGYKYTTFYDGESAYNHLVESMKTGSTKYDIIISDIEMPKMDGMRFCKLCKENVDYKTIPFVMFSSLIDEQMERKCKEIGSDACITKPEIGNLIGEIQKLVFK